MDSPVGVAHGKGKETAIGKIPGRHRPRVQSACKQTRPRWEIAMVRPANITGANVTAMMAELRALVTAWETCMDHITLADTLTGPAVTAALQTMIDGVGQSFLRRRRIASRVKISAGHFLTLSDTEKTQE